MAQSNLPADDYALLLHVDLQILALMYELELEDCGSKVEYVRTQPKSKSIIQ